MSFGGGEKLMSEIIKKIQNHIPSPSTRATVVEEGNMGHGFHGPISKESL
jgi:hypothetical protein